VAVTACIWYFTGQGSDSKGEKPSFSVFSGFKWAFTYHMGSLAFGSFLIAVITFIRIVFEYFCKKFEKIIDTNPVSKIIICCVRMCLGCLDCCVKFISENAFV
jgi:hypothetical protein